MGDQRFFSFIEAKDACGFHPTAETSFSQAHSSRIRRFAESGRKGLIHGAKGKRLFYRFHLQEAPSNAVVVVSGRTETVSKYDELAFDFFRHGHSLYLYDHRGQGLSDRICLHDRQLGHVEAFEHYVEDLRIFLDGVVRPRNHRRIYLLGHSMGGCIVSLYLEAGARDIRAAALSSPMHAPRIGPPGAASRLIAVCIGLAARPFGARYAPGTGPYDSQMPFENNPLTQSRARFRRMQSVYEAQPEARLGGPSLHWAAEACRASRKAIRLAGRIRTPVLVLQAGADRIVCNRAQADFVAQLKANSRPCEAATIPGARHELLMEADRFRAPALARILDFFNLYR